MMQTGPSLAHAKQRGFTLVEVLVALALTSMVLVSLNLASTTVRRAVETSGRSLSDQAALTAAVDVFQRDVARIAKLRRGAEGAGYVFEGSARQMIYPVPEHQGASPGGLYMVRLTASSDDGITQLIRDRAPVLPGDTPDATDDFQDEVVLLEGRFDITFSYRAQRTGSRSWADSWTNPGTMPEQIRLTIGDGSTGRLRLPVIVQSLLVDAEVECTGAPGCGGNLPDVVPQ
jgi:prepilin-type N-terminal cleavage/methylation domain-containing protein